MSSPASAAAKASSGSRGPSAAASRGPGCAGRRPRSRRPPSLLERVDAQVERGADPLLVDLAVAAAEVGQRPGHPPDPVQASPAQAVRLQLPPQDQPRRLGERGDLVQQRTGDGSELSPWPRAGAAQAGRATRAATTRRSAPRPAPPAARRPPGRATSRRRSNRSSSGPDTRRRYLKRSPSPQRQAPGWPLAPHGHGFMAATSWKRAGNSHRGPRPRDPHDALLQGLAQAVEHGRLELAQLVEEEHAAVGQATPRPGACSRCRRRPWPPATPCGAGPAAAAGGPGHRAGAGRRPSGSWWSPAPRPGPRAGSSPGRRWASMVLPAPGGPSSRRWWPPAAATSTARRAETWPRTSARSGGASGATGSAPARPARPRRVAGEHGDQLGQGVAPSGPRAAATSAASASQPGRHDRRRLAERGDQRHDARDPRGSSRPARARRGRPARRRRSAGTASEATSTPTAMARSSPAPLLRTPDGARLTVMRCQRPRQPARQERRTDAVARLPARLVGQADDAEGGQAVGHVDLDRDGAPLGAEQRG